MKKPSKVFDESIGCFVLVYDDSYFDYQQSKIDEQRALIKKYLTHEVN